MKLAVLALLMLPVCGLIPTYANAQDETQNQLRNMMDRQKEVIEKIGDSGCSLFGRSRTFMGAIGLSP